jgi:hypothetical protein
MNPVINQAEEPFQGPNARKDLLKYLDEFGVRLASLVPLYSIDEATILRQPATTRVLGLIQVLRVDFVRSSGFVMSFVFNGYAIT